MNSTIYKPNLKGISIKHIFCLLVISLFCVTASNAKDIDSQRVAFKEAVKLAEQGKSQSLTHQKTLLQDYLLRSDIRAIYLKKTLRNQNNKTIENFLSNYPDQATSNDLLRAWLDHLYKTKQWNTYLTNAPVPDPLRGRTSRRCQYIEAQFNARQPVDLAQAALPIWMVGKSQPDECDGLFSILKSKGLLSQDRINARIDLTLEKAKFQLAGYLSGYLPSSERKSVARKTSLWRKMSASPERILKESLQWKDGKISRAIIGYGVRKQARINVDKAISVWGEIKNKFDFSVSQRNSIESYLALRAAYQRHPKTQDVYMQTDNGRLSMLEREWQIRNALWKQDWRTVLIAIDQMPEEKRRTSQWQYWSARALTQLGQKAEANVIYQRLAQSHGYFEFLAADQLEAGYQFTHTPININESLLQQLSQRHDLQRARELVHVNMPGRSRSEWRSALKRMSPDEKTQAGLLAQRWDLPTSSIQTAVNSGARSDIDILYPRAYEAHVLKTAKRFALDPAWVFGVIRQESLFMPDVRSSANAYGLMQLLPATAKQTARKNKIKYNGYSHLITPERNIELGSAYLAEVNKRLQSNPALATAAYNGGPHRVRKWLPDYDMPADIWVENIVFKETRHYVQKVLTNKVIYSWRMQGQPLRLNSFMKPVRPLNAVRTAQN